MRFFQKKEWYTLSIILVFIMAMLIGCDSGSNDSTDPNGGDSTSDPGVGNLAGKVTGTVGGQALAGVQVTIGAKATTTDNNGLFQLNSVGSGILTVVLNGNSIYPRTVPVNTETGRSVRIDAIERSSGFHLGFYRELARGNAPGEDDVFPTHRWITAPTFYINTNAQAAIDGRIDQTTIDTVRTVLASVIPVFTGGVYTSPRIETRFFASPSDFSQLPANSFVISFDDTLVNDSAYGQTFTDPDWISPNTSSISKTSLFVLDNAGFYKNSAHPSYIAMNEIVAHETGHGMGFRHATILPSVMTPVEEFGGLYSESDRLHMAIVYKRLAGNRDIDNDPIPGAKMLGDDVGPQVFIDQRANISLSPEMIQQLQALQGFTH